jgi:hypothetical protein
VVSSLETQLNTWVGARRCCWEDSPTHALAIYPLLEGTIDARFATLSRPSGVAIQDGETAFLTKNACPLRDTCIQDLVHISYFLGHSDPCISGPFKPSMGQARKKTPRVSAEEELFSGQHIVVVQ